MAYLNEFPNFEAPQRNLDFILEQYSTFNKRIKEINDHFDEAVATIQGEVEELNNDFEDFVETVNDDFDTLSEDLQEQVNEAITEIQSQINDINTHMEEYIASHIDEWQQDASFNNGALVLGSGEYSEGAPVREIDINGEAHLIHSTNANVKAYTLGKTDTYSSTSYTYTFTINNASKLSGIFLVYNCPSVDDDTFHIINTSNINITRNSDSYSASVTITGLTLEGSNLIMISGYYLSVEN